MLDVSIRLGVLNLLKALKSEGISIVYITHDLASARYLADTILVLYKGEVVERGDVHEVLTAPKHPYTQLLLAAVPHPDVPIDTPLPPRPKSDSQVGNRDEKRRQAKQRYECQIHRLLRWHSHNQNPPKKRQRRRD